MTTGKVIAIVCGAAAILISIPVGCVIFNSRQEQAELDEQLKQARLDGLPTTGDEFAAMLPKVKDSENAALIYSKFANSHKKLLHSDLDLEKKMLAYPSAYYASDATEYLGKFSRELELVDQAARLPRCVFNRDWHKGISVLQPEIYPTKRFSSMILVRGAVRASEGKVAQAIADFRETLCVAGHLQESKEQMGILTGKIAEWEAIKALASWVLAFPAEQRYRKELVGAVRNMKSYVLKDVHRQDLLDVLTAIDLCETTEGQKELGLKPNEVSKFDKVMPLLQSKRAAKTMTIRSLRDYFKELDNRSPGYIDRISNAKSGFYRGLATFPTVAHLYSEMSDNPSTEYIWLNLKEARQIAFEAFFRATRNGRIASAVDTSDLKSPYTGKPIKYSYDGQQMAITVEVGSGIDPFILRILRKQD